MNREPFNDRVERAAGKIICQSCCKPIECGSPVVRVEVGTLGFTCHPHAVVLKKTCDWFHKDCDVAIRSKGV